MIKIHEGDIFKAPVDIIIHSCNCMNTMGSGIAKQIKQLFPDAYIADCKTKQGDHNKLGKFSHAEQNGKLIFNMYGQYDYGTTKKCYTNYIAVAEALQNILYWLNEQKFQGKTIGVPYKMGSDRGGGDWEVIESIIKNTFDNSAFDVLICKI